MTFELTLKSGSFLDFAFGKLTKGKEMQVFGEYFPLINPLLEECSIQPLCSFAVLATNSPDMAPEQGSLTRVPSTESFTRFHSDPRFIKARPIRDNAMEFLADGNFFRSLDKTVTLDEDADYALIITEGSPLKIEPLLELPAAKDSPKQIYSGKSMALHQWSDDAELIMNTSPAEAVVFRIRFNPSGS